jgi:hypothetical protein
MLPLSSPFLQKFLFSDAGAGKRPDAAAGAKKGPAKHRPPLAPQNDLRPDAAELAGISLSRCQTLKTETGEEKRGA